jgi:hypothetical protein
VPTFLPFKQLQKPRKAGRRGYRAGGHIAGDNGINKTVADGVVRIGHPGLMFRSAGYAVRVDSWR